MPATIIVGAQWGDEGKGRVADWLAAQSDVVARFAGGDNAGHTVYVGDKVYKLHLIPSGILHERVICVLGGGMVVNPVNLLKEIDDLAALGVNITPERLIISTRAHIITPAHVALDKASEKALGAGKIGTTLRGIGPAYMDKTGRSGLRMGQMLEVESFADALYAHIEAANARLFRDGCETIDPQKSAEDYIDAAARLRPFLRDTTPYLNARLRAGDRVLCEGAQGTMLDIDHGDYPFVTSSSPTSGGALTGLGFGPLYVDRVVGVTKSFSTRVGSGPMPTELEGEPGARLRGTGEHFWDEFGTTTGRPRRCGWLDTVMLRYSVEVNGFTELVLTKLDVLSGFDEVFVATAYELDGKVVDVLPFTTAEQGRAKPIYDRLAGWHEDISGVRQWSDLPEAARAYIDRIAALCGTPINTVSVGPERDQLVHRSSA
ncbi:MAG TPA: adenylosuccinate synthase [Phototrophicaceae bacterium]|nr:adenylosuccinate synthase [Phototrophicaceae bacterium]